MVVHQLAVTQMAAAAAVEPLALRVRAKLVATRLPGHNVAAVAVAVQMAVQVQWVEMLLLVGLKQVGQEETATMARVAERLEMGAIISRAATALRIKAQAAAALAAMLPARLATIPVVMDLVRKHLTQHTA
jgi:hypothetical protein